MEAACRKSLQALQLDYLDLYLIHWPVTGNRGPAVQPSLLETWHAMQARKKRAAGHERASLFLLKMLLLMILLMILLIILLITDCGGKYGR